MSDTVIITVVTGIGVLLTTLTTAIGILWRSTEVSHKAVSASHVLSQLSLKMCETENDKLNDKIDALRAEVKALQDSVMESLKQKAADTAAVNVQNKEKIHAVEKQQDVISASVDKLKSEKKKP